MGKKLPLLHFTSRERADLHIHSHFSDGVHSPKELAALAARNNLSVIALTDHAQVVGIIELTLAAASHGIYVIPGIELNANEGDLLGLFIDYHCKGLLQFLKEVNHYRLTRTSLIVKTLQEIGYSITLNELRAFADPAIPARSHIARLLVKTGQIADVNTAFNELLGKGSVTYIPGEAPSEEECISIIQQAGGLVVEAHPQFSLHAKTDSEIAEHFASMVNLGVIGFETGQGPDGAMGLQGRIKDISTAAGLLRLGGSDFHGKPLSVTEMGANSIGCDMIKQLDKRLPKNCQHKSFIKRMQWRHDNLTSREFANSLTPQTVDIARLEFLDLMQRPSPAVDVPPGFQGKPFILVRGKAIEQEDVIQQMLADAGGQILSRVYSHNFLELSWDIYNLQRGSKIDQLRDVGKFNLDLHLFGNNSSECLIIFFSPINRLGHRELKLLIRRQLGEIRFYKLVCNWFTETYLTTFIHIPDEDKVDIECWRIHQLGIEIPGDGENRSVSRKKSEQIP